MPKHIDRFLKELSNGSKIFEGYAILWNQYLDAGVFTKDTQITLVKHPSTDGKSAYLPVILRFSMPDTGDFVEAVVGRVINQRYTSKGFFVRFELDGSTVTAQMLESLYHFLRTEKILMTVSAFQNHQVGLDAKGMFTHFPVNSIYLHSEDQIADVKETEEETLRDE